MQRILLRIAGKGISFYFVTRAEKFLEMLMKEYDQKLAPFAKRVGVSDRQVRNWTKEEKLSESAIEKIANGYAIPADIVRAVANAGAELPEEYRGKESWALRVAGIESEAMAIRWLEGFVTRIDAAKLVKQLKPTTVDAWRKLLLNSAVGRGVNVEDRHDGASTRQRE